MNNEQHPRPLKAALIVSGASHGFIESLRQTLESRGYTDVIHMSPLEALEMARKSAIQFAAICMDGACETQKMIRTIFMERGNMNFAFIPADHNADSPVFDRFLGALK